MAISKKSWTGVAFEASQGTAATTPTVFVPCKSVMKKMVGKHRPDDERASRDKNVAATTNLTRKSTIDPKGDWYNDVSPYFLIGFMGGVSSAQPNAGSAPTVWKHTLSLADAPKTLTMFKGYDDGTNGYYMAMSGVEKVTLKWSSDKSLEIDTALVGLQHKLLSAAPSSITFSSLRAFAGWEPTITYGGGSSQDIEEVEIDLEQKIELFYPSYGSPDPVKLYFGERSGKVKFTARCDTPAVYNKYDTGQTDSLTVDFLGDLIASTYHQELNLTIPTIDWDNVVQDLGKTNVLVKAEGTIMATGNVNNWISGYVQNTVTSYTI